MQLRPLLPRRHQRLPLPGIPCSRQRILFRRHRQGQKKGRLPPQGGLGRGQGLEDDLPASRAGQQAQKPGRWPFPVGGPDPVCDGFGVREEGAPAVPLAGARLSDRGVPVPEVLHRHPEEPRQPLLTGRRQQAHGFLAVFPDGPLLQQWQALRRRRRQRLTPVPPGAHQAEHGVPEPRVR